MTDNNTIAIKPHHLLDILKLHGKGLDVFIPDADYGHDFYRVANKVVQNEAKFVIFTIHDDDICKPCRYREGHVCTDQVSKTDSSSKEAHNQEIDSVLFDLLGLRQGQKYEFQEIKKLLKDKLSYELFQSAWSHAKKEELDFRFENTLKGLEKVM